MKLVQRALLSGVAVVIALAAAGCGGGGASPATAPMPAAVAPAPADMVVTAFNAPSAGVAGQTYTVSGTVVNRGAGHGIATALVYLAAVDNVTNLDFDVGMLGLAVLEGFLAPGQSWNFEFDVRVPTNAANGNYSIGVVVPYAPEGESNPADNKRSQPFTLSGGTTCSNDSYEADNSAAEAKLLAFRTSQVHNHCDGTSDWVKFDAVAGTTYGIATSQVGNKGWTQFTLYAPDAKTVLSYGTPQFWDIESGYLRWTAPLTGTYYLRVSPFFGLSHAGADTGYRIALGDVLPDLVVEALYTPATGLPGGSISLNDTVFNRGFADAGSFDVSVYLSSSPNVTTSDTLLGSRTVSALAVGKSDASRTLTYALPADLNPGTYYLGAFVNAKGALSEFTTDNNVRVNPITIQPLSGCNPDAYEPDDVAAAARPITIGAAAHPHNHCEDDVDWLSFNAVGAGRDARAQPVRRRD